MHSALACQLSLPLSPSLSLPLPPVQPFLQTVSSANVVITESGMAADQLMASPLVHSLPLLHTSILHTLISHSAIHSYQGSIISKQQ